MTVLENGWFGSDASDSLAHKSNSADHVILTTRRRRRRFLHLGIFLRENPSLRQVDNRTGFDMGQHLGTVALVVHDGFLRFHE